MNRAYRALFDVVCQLELMGASFAEPEEDIKTRLGNLLRAIDELCVGDFWAYVSERYESSIGDSSIERTTRLVELREEVNFES